jgi:hypothetical protein
VKQIHSLMKGFVTRAGFAAIERDALVSDFQHYQTATTANDERAAAADFPMILGAGECASFTGTRLLAPPHLRAIVKPVGI